MRSLLFVGLLATSANAQLIDGARVGRPRQETPRLPRAGSPNIFAQRVVFAVPLGSLAALPFAVVAGASYSNTPLVVGGAAYLWTVSEVVATITNGQTRCTKEARRARSFRGTVIGATLATGIGLGFASEHLKGARAILVAGSGFLAPAVGAALDVRRCD